MCIYIPAYIYVKYESLFECKYKKYKYLITKKKKLMDDTKHMDLHGFTII